MPFFGIFDTAKERVRFACGVKNDERRPKKTRAETRVLKTVTAEPRVGSTIGGAAGTSSAGNTSNWASVGRRDSTFDSVLVGAINDVEEVVTAGSDVVETVVDDVVVEVVEVVEVVVVVPGRAMVVVVVAATVVVVGGSRN